MKDSVKIAPSLLSADFSRLAEEIRALERAGADWLHVDVMDGHFVPNITIGPPVIESIREVSSLPLDVHLMIHKPEHYLEDFVKAGADILSVHVETSVHLHRTIECIRKMGARPGVVLNPATPIHHLEHVLHEVEIILVMTVDPGFGGQKFIPGMLSKIRALRRWLDREEVCAELEVDGGIKLENIADVASSGATVFVSGSGILKTPDYAATISGMREEIRKAREAGGGFHEAKGISLPGGG